MRTALALVIARRAQRALRLTEFEALDVPPKTLHYLIRRGRVQRGADGRYQFIEGAPLPLETALWMAVCANGAAVGAERFTQAGITRSTLLHLTREGMLERAGDGYAASPRLLESTRVPPVPESGAPPDRRTAALALADGAPGPLRLRDFMRSGIPASTVYRLVSSGALCQVGRGRYARPPGGGHQHAEA
ncbi:type IV toxin-antitoxin system AbiEi family antitoxin domain-containing protein [Azospirillum brasilense]|uniref:AbiEi antitoxin N-terminal domain-containing protein n=1 Tax=Azospirillum brasilense TaxID=192 RepID=A0A6L3B1K0_AZOBR|nr:type IV toxin-antitoxin system AbiEi family antitoxin domain-containing protein [Azospirillum brasilense]KAA0686194.1 hypothetical protein DS837_10880 [Azospirillum brasilense]